MANIYVRSTDGSDADNGTTWALAKATVAGAAAIDSTTDRTIMVSQSHAESVSGAQNYTWNGSQALPTIVRCVDDSAEPPTTATTGASVTTDSVISFTQSTSFLYVEGISFKSGNGSSSLASINLAGSTGTQCRFVNCSFHVATTHTGSGVSLHGSAGLVELENCTVRFGNASQSITTAAATAVKVVGLTLGSGATSPSVLFGALSSGSIVDVSGLNLENASASINLCSSTNPSVRFVCRNARLPASWSGSYHSGTPGRGSRFSFYNCDSADTNYRLHIATAMGTIVSETTVVRTGGASDGTTTLSWKMVSGADAEWPLLSLETDEIVRWQDTTGSAITVTVEMVTDNVTLKDTECELHVLYLGTSGQPLGSFSNSGNTNTLATGSNIATSTETWTTTGLTTPVKQKMSVTFTPEEKGYIHATVRLYRASTTVYVDPELTVT